MTEAPAAAWAGVERFPLFGVAVDVRSLYNVGAIFRASDAARVSHLYLTGMSGHPSRNRAAIDKTSLGSQAVVPWTFAPDPLPAIEGLRARGVRVAALEVSPASKALSTVDASWFPLALVVGHEVNGVPAAVLARCDEVLRIETWGRKPSLNVALAYGVAVVTLAGVWARHTASVPLQPLGCAGAAPSCTVTMRSAPE